MTYAYPKDFRAEVLRRYLAGEQAPDLEAELGVKTHLIYKWAHLDGVSKAPKQRFIQARTALAALAAQPVDYEVLPHDPLIDPRETLQKLVLLLGA